MISVEAALAECLSLMAPLSSETVSLEDATGRVLTASVIAARDQPPFAASAMDGYAVQSADVAQGARLQVVGEAPAGAPWPGTLSPGQALRIFTGAPIPAGADRVVIQENVERSGDTITLSADIGPGTHIRPAAGDFRQGDPLPAPRRLSPADIALAAAMGVDTLHVARKPQVALLATGDELVPPGTAPGPGQIIASNAYGLAALLRQAGATPRILPIARDTDAALLACLNLARDADLIVTIGGASVGDYDLVGQAAGLDLAFYKVAMRPGKPLMAGRWGDVPLLGLPGNPVSAMICGQVFLVPMVRKALGLPASQSAPRHATLTTGLPENGPRTHYMRAQCSDDGAGIAPVDSQDSSLLSRLSAADALIVRPPNAPEAAEGERVPYLPLLA